MSLDEAMNISLNNHSIPLQSWRDIEHARHPGNYMVAGMCIRSVIPIGYVSGCAI
jgi:hypothetical protein